MSNNPYRPPPVPSPKSNRPAASGIRADSPDWVWMAATSAGCFIGAYFAWPTGRLLEPEGILCFFLIAFGLFSALSAYLAYRLARQP